jgi:hypothetical protein
VERSVNNEYDKTWKEVVVVELYVPSWHTLGGAEGKHQKPAGIIEVSAEIRTGHPSDPIQQRHYWSQSAAVNWRCVSEEHDKNLHNRHTLKYCNEIKDRRSKATGQHSFQRLAPVHFIAADRLYLSICQPPEEVTVVQEHSDPLPGNGTAGCYDTNVASIIAINRNGTKIVELARLGFCLVKYTAARTACYTCKTLVDQIKKRSSPFSQNLTS